MRVTLTDLKHILSKSLHDEAVDRLLTAYEEIRINFYLGQNEPAELNANKLCEVMVRILEVESHRKMTPFNKSIRNMNDYLKNFEGIVSATDSIRFYSHSSQCDLLYSK